MMTHKLLFLGEVLAMALAFVACSQPSEPVTGAPETPSPGAVPAAEQPAAPAPLARRGWRWRSSAEEPPLHAGWSFDPATVETVEGEVSEIVFTPTHGRRGGGVHLRLATDRGDLTIALGPASFLEEQDTAIATGDRVRVRGARVDDDLLVAVVVQRGADQLVLRSEDGVPAWRGTGRRGGPPPDP